MTPAVSGQEGRLMKRIIGLVIALMLAAVPGAWAQASGGNIYGTVTDASGAVLPAATITITGANIGSRTTQSGPNGEFRFLNLDPGNYKLAVSMSGFATVNREVVVTTGQSVNLTFAMKLSTLAEQVTVTAETPVVDTKRVGTATTLTKDELTRVPQGRDPWAILNQVPGVLVDRVSVAGNEAGQQSLFVGKGAQFTDTMWSYDGIVITDVTSYGASSMYFDFDSFDEVNVSTGGGDLKVQTGGLGLNFVTKRGTNAFHGSIRSFFSHDDLQSTNTPTSLKSDSRLLNGKADHIEQIHDYGIDLGGPIIKDKLWFWGSYGKNDIRLYRLIGPARDKTLLKNYNAKLSWQASSKDQVSFNWFNGIKSKFGRDPGYAGSNGALWDQGSFYAEEKCGLPCGLHGLSKVEWNHTFSNDLIVTAKYAFFNWGYGFDPQNGADQDLSFDRVANTAKGSAEAFRFLKPWHTANVDGSYFKPAFGGSNEFRFGFSYRHWPNSSSGRWSGNGIVAVYNNDEPDDPTSRVAWVTRSGVVKFEDNFTSAYLGDTFTRGRATLNVGARYDRQTGKNSPSTAKANPLFPNLLPDLSFDGNTPAITFNDVSPRVGLTLALDEKRKTVLRASYARYAGQLGGLDTTFNSPVTYGYTYLAYRWVDRNSDGFAQREEILTNEGVVYTSGNVDPAHPAALSSINKIDPNYHANRDHEAILGIEHELAPNLSVGAAYTWRRGTDSTAWTPRVDSSGRILTSSEYIALAPVSAGGFTVQPYAPDDDKLGEGARILTNRPDFSLHYSGLELTAYKRMSNNWMARAAFSYMNWTEHLDGPGAFQNPSSASISSIIQGGYPGGANSGLCGPCIDGGPVVLKSYGAKTNTFANSKWSVSASGLYQLPAGFELGAAFLGRQGFPKVMIIRTGLGSDGARLLLPTGGVDIERYKNFWNLDVRLAKNLKLGGRVSTNITVDLFNVFNSDTVQQANRQINSDTFGQILEITNPRILRLGVRLQF
jgi:carboxypeptidase family protein